MSTTQERGTAKIAEHREELEDIATSELPANWIAEVLLEVAEE